MALAFLNANALKLAVTGKGSSPSLKDGCQAATIWDEEATFV